MKVSISIMIIAIALGYYIGSWPVALGVLLHGLGIIIIRHQAVKQGRAQGRQWAIEILQQMSDESSAQSAGSAGNKKPPLRDTNTYLEKY